MCDDFDASSPLLAVLDANWTQPGHRDAALREGWILSPADGSTHGVLQVQSVDDPPLIDLTWGLPFTVPALASDSEAWALVRDGTAPHHLAAHALLAQFNPAELGCISLGAPAVTCPARAPEQP